MVSFQPDQLLLQLMQYFYIQFTKRVMTRLKMDYVVVIV